jgi:plasmid stabilization system protein ParE
MVEVRWTLQASQDLGSIVAFLDKDSFQYARLFVVDIFQAIERIAEFPESGRMVPEFGDPVVREVILGNYRLVYRLGGKGIEILTVYHGARLLNLDKLR